VGAADVEHARVGPLLLLVELGAVLGRDAFLHLVQVLSPKALRRHTKRETQQRQTTTNTMTM